jgi:hypothetical protein
MKRRERRDSNPFLHAMSDAERCAEERVTVTRFSIDCKGLGGLATSKGFAPAKFEAASLGLD